MLSSHQITSIISTHFSKFDVKEKVGSFSLTLVKSEHSSRFQKVRIFQYQSRESFR